VCCDALTDTHQLTHKLPHRSLTSLLPTNGDVQEHLGISSGFGHFQEDDNKEIRRRLEEFKFVMFQYNLSTIPSRIRQQVGWRIRALIRAALGVTIRRRRRMVMMVRWIWRTI